MLMLLCVHMTRVLFLVWFNNFVLTMGFLLELHALTLVARSYVLLPHTSKEKGALYLPQKGGPPYLVFTTYLGAAAVSLRQERWGQSL